MDRFIEEIKNDEKSYDGYITSIPDYLGSLGETVNYNELLELVQTYPVVKSLFIDALGGYCKQTWDYDSSPSFILPN